MSATAYASSSLSSKDQSGCTSSTASQVPQLLPLGFDSQIAYLLGLCCLAANNQYATYVTTTAPNKQNPFDPTSWQIDKVGSKPWDPDFSQIAALGYKPNPDHYNLSVYETDINDDTVEIPAGFIARLEPTDINKSGMIVVAFHGTQNSFEMFQIDNDIFPHTFGGSIWNLGTVHGGFYKQYTTGSGGNQKDLPGGADGSLAQQISNYLSKTADVTLPVYVTGHSLGGALATLSALDIAYNFKPKFKSVSMYSLASPRVADAWNNAQDKGGAGTFVSNYQQHVPDSYRIVNTADSVPTLPSPLTPPVLTTNLCAHVLGDDLAKLFGIVKPSWLDLNVVSFTDTNTVNDQDSPQPCQGAHSCPAVYVPFLYNLAFPKS